MVVVVAVAACHLQISNKKTEKENYITQYIVDYYE